MQRGDRNGAGNEALMNARNQLLDMAAKNSKRAGVRTNGLADVAQFKIDIDSKKASALGIPLSDINSALQIAWGSSYVNDFIDNGRIKRVYMQADAQHRMVPKTLRSGMCVIIMAKWLHSVHSRLQNGRLARHS